MATRCFSVQLNGSAARRASARGPLYDALADQMPGCVKDRVTDEPRLDRGQTFGLTPSLVRAFSNKGIFMDPGTLTGAPADFSASRIARTESLLVENQRLVSPVRITEVSAAMIEISSPVWRIVRQRCLAFVGSDTDDCYPTIVCARDELLLIEK
jgi:hypothetical protein